MFVWCSAVIHPAALRSQVRGMSVSVLFVKFKVKGRIFQKFLLQKSEPESSVEVGLRLLPPQPDSDLQTKTCHFI